VTARPGGPYENRRGPVAPVFGVPLERSSRQGRISSADATNLVASDNTHVSMTTEHVVVGFMRPYRDAELVVVTSNTGADGPRLVPRRPPGLKAAPSSATDVDNRHHIICESEL